MLLFNFNYIINLYIDFFFYWTVSRVLFTFLFLKRKLGLALRRMGFKVPFCRCQVVRKCWVQVQGKTLQSGLILCFCRRRNFSPVSAAEETFLQFLPQKKLFSSFCHKTDFSAMQQNFLLRNEVSCCAVKFSVMHWSCLLCIKAFCRTVKLSVVKSSVVQ